LLQRVDLVADQQRVDAGFDRLYELPDRAIRALQLRPVGMKGRVIFRPQTVHVSGIFDAKNLAQILTHQSLPQGAEHDLFKLTFGDGQTVGTGSFIFSRCASVIRSAELGEAAAALPAFEQE